jgi:CRP/FNR family transcriptional regulator, cyclic AMP receptor protein
MAGSLFNIQERLAHNVFAPVRSRVARYLLDVATPAGAGHVAAPSHVAEPSHVAAASYEDIAGAIGTVREVVARTLAALRDDGLIRRTEEGIALIDLDGLRAAAQADEFRDFRRRP